MNMFRLGDYIYCSYFIFLNKEDDNKFIQQKVLLTMKKDSSNELVSYKIFN